MPKGRLLAIELWRTDNPCTRTQSYLHESNWARHSLKRVELQGQLGAVRQTVEDPDFALRDDSGVVYKYRMGHGSGSLRRLWLLVIEEADLVESYYVKTAYFTPEVKDYSILCVRRIRWPG